jgi:hypothetical protein
MDSKTFGSLKAYMTLADQLVAKATKEELAEAAKILALNVAHYASRYGELPIQEHLNFLQLTELSEEQASLITRGLETFVGVLGSAVGRERPMH